MTSVPFAALPPAAGVALWAKTAGLSRAVAASAAAPPVALSIVRRLNVFRSIRYPFCLEKPTLRITARCVAPSCCRAGSRGNCPHIVAYIIVHPDRLRPVTITSPPFRRHGGQALDGSHAGTGTDRRPRPSECAAAAGG